MENSSDILGNKSGNIYTITFNRPNKKNALNVPHYKEIINHLEVSKKDEDIKVVYITAVGDTFCAGFDFSAFLEFELEEIIKTVKNFFDYLIDYPKVIVVGVNGKAIGIGFTFLFFTDVVFCSDNASFTSPFIKVGLFPEGCSSFLFNLHLGRSMASNLLLGGGELSASQAKEYKIVLDMYKKENFQENVKKYLLNLSNFSSNKLMLIKEMMNKQWKEKLKMINEYETGVILENSLKTSDEIIQMIEKFSKKLENKNLNPKF